MRINVALRVLGINPGPVMPERGWEDREEQCKACHSRTGIVTEAHADNCRTAQFRAAILYN